MKDITSTIQKEQNAIIRDTKNPHILVNGIAGSGKTSTIMQRVAYLLYSLRQEITSDNMLILSPNHGFIEYIANVLPALGERNPVNLTMLQFVEKELGLDLEGEEDYFTRITAVKPSQQTQILRSQEFVDFIQQADELLLQQGDYFQAVMHKGKVLISKATVLKFYESTPDYLQFIDKLQATKKMLTSYWERWIIKKARSLETQNQILSLSEELQYKYFGELIADDSEESIFRYGKKLLKQKYRAVFREIQENHWFNQQRVFQDVFKAYKNAEYGWESNDYYTLDEGIVLLMIKDKFVEKLALTSIRYLLVDEVQDYTKAQLALLLELFPKAKLTLVGDENQAIFNSTISFQEIEQAFLAQNQVVVRYNLLSSYRSSGAITKLFSQLVTNNETLEIIPVRPDGQAIQLFSLTNEADVLSVINQIQPMLKDGKLTIITKTATEAEQLSSLLETEASTIAVFPVSLSKGLEFDNILLYNVSASNYTSPRDKKILYTAVSRGMQQLFLTYQGEFTKLLPLK